MVDIAAVWKQFLFIGDSGLGRLDASARGVFELFHCSLPFNNDLQDISIEETELEAGGVFTFVSPVSIFNASREYADSGIQKKIRMSARAKAPPIACKAIR